ncbi:MAG: PTS sugar transporter subunit IIB [Bacillota bacterium]
MKIMVVCGSGLGSSFMLELNVKKVLKELQITAEVDHCDLSSASGERADLFVATRDIAGQLSGKTVVSLNNMIDLKELKEKLGAALGSVL